MDDPVRRVRRFVVDFCHDGSCTLIGGGRSVPDRAALYNGGLVRCLDFNDRVTSDSRTDQLHELPLPRRLHTPEHVVDLFGDDSGAQGPP
jgi:hypothetical protein